MPARRAQIALYYYQKGNFDEARKYGEDAVELYKKVATNKQTCGETVSDDLNDCKQKLAFSLNVLGSVYSRLGDRRKSEDFYGKSLSLREQLYDQSPESYWQDYVSALNKAGSSLYDSDDAKDKEKGRRYIIEAYGVFNKFRNSENLRQPKKPFHKVHDFDLMEAELSYNMALVTDDMQPKV